MHSLTVALDAAQVTPVHSHARDILLWLAIRPEVSSLAVSRAEPRLDGSLGCLDLVMNETGAVLDDRIRSRGGRSNRTMVNAFHSRAETMDALQNRTKRHYRS